MQEMGQWGGGQWTEGVEGRWMGNVVQHTENGVEDGCGAAGMWENGFSAETKVGQECIPSGVLTTSTVETSLLCPTEMDESESSWKGKEV